MDRVRLASAARANGFSLPEFLTVMTILVLLLAVGLPGMRDQVARSRADSSLQQLRALLGFARTSAITRNREVTLCGTANGTDCSNTWDNWPTIVFVDANANRRLDANEPLLLQSELTRAARILWRASGNRNYLRYKPDGGVGEFGHFLYCPTGGDARFARKLVVSATGRARHARDTNADWIVDDGSANLVCPP